VVVTASEAEHVPAAPIDGPVDPTGAGDTFWVSYLVARSQGAAPIEAARHATELTSTFLAERRTTGIWRV
jgi:sugar/nucleoside kinase (ribokinase family)